MNRQPSNSSEDLCYPVYIRGLSREATKEDVKIIFTQFGAIKEGGVTVTHVEGLIPGYAYGIVKFQDRISMEKAIQKSSVTICGKESRVEKVQRTGQAGYPSSVSKDGLCIVSQLGVISGLDFVKAPGSSTTLIPSIVDAPALAHDSTTSSGPAHVSTTLSGPTHDSTTSSGPAHVSTTLSGPAHESTTSSGPAHVSTTLCGPAHDSTTSSVKILRNAVKFITEYIKKL